MLLRMLTNTYLTITEIKVILCETERPTPPWLVSIRKLHRRVRQIYNSKVFNLSNCLNLPKVNNDHIENFDTILIQGIGFIRNRDMLLRMLTNTYLTITEIKVGLVWYRKLHRRVRQIYNSKVFNLSNCLNLPKVNSKTYSKCDKLHIDTATTVAHINISLEHGVFYMVAVSICNLSHLLYVFE
jgi:hypothetical protein